ncbi:hypothetical protein Pmani_007297 [Petrolisthes manimaculis]|uniref:Uncharacterized protein n=1 Tax=Petrolisthes manimaculis TaxID=1843537 RepID=A0AAE1Q809_9EUCA|nr:hypothetical protein Pmani_007297 [Petrolisthes manimaculis]
MPSGTFDNRRVFTNGYGNSKVRKARLVNEGVVVAATTRDQNNLSETVWGNYGNCRTLILNLNYNKNNTISALRLLERIGYWKLSETRVVVVGGMPEMKDVLLHHSFRNTANALYLAINPEHLVTSRSGLHFNSNLSSESLLLTCSLSCRIFLIILLKQNTLLDMRRSRAAVTSSNMSPAGDALDASNAK